MTRVELPVDSCSRIESLAPVARDFREERFTRSLGTRWLVLNRELVTSVPSAVVPDARNYLVNPAHPDFGKIMFFSPVSIEFDARLK